MLRPCTPGGCPRTALFWLPNSPLVVGISALLFSAGARLFHTLPHTIGPDGGRQGPCLGCSGDTEDRSKEGFSGASREAAATVWKGTWRQAKGTGKDTWPTWVP